MTYKYLTKQRYCVNRDNKYNRVLKHHNNVPTNRYLKNRHQGYRGSGKVAKCDIIVCNNDSTSVLTDSSAHAI